MRGCLARSRTGILLSDHRLLLVARTRSRFHLATERAMEIYKDNWRRRGGGDARRRTGILNCRSVVVGIARPTSLKSWVPPSIRIPTATGRIHLRHHIGVCLGVSRIRCRQARIVRAMGADRGRRGPAVWTEGLATIPTCSALCSGCCATAAYLLVAGLSLSLVLRKLPLRMWLTTATQATASERYIVPPHHVSPQLLCNPALYVPVFLSAKRCFLHQ